MSLLALMTELMEHNSTPAGGLVNDIIAHLMLSGPSRNASSRDIDTDSASSSSNDTPDQIVLPDSDQDDESVSKQDYFLDELDKTADSQAQVDAVMYSFINLLDSSRGKSSSFSSAIKSLIRDILDSKVPLKTIRRGLHMAMITHGTDAQIETFARENGSFPYWTISLLIMLRETPLMQTHTLPASTQPFLTLAENRLRECNCENCRAYIFTGLAMLVCLGYRKEFMQILAIMKEIHFSRMFIPDGYPETDTATIHLQAVNTFPSDEIPEEFIYVLKDKAHCRAQDKIIISVTSHMEKILRDTLRGKNM